MANLGTRSAGDDYACLGPAKGSSGDALAAAAAVVAVGSQLLAAFGCGRQFGRRYPIHRCCSCTKAPSLGWPKSDTRTFRAVRSVRIEPRARLTHDRRMDTIGSDWIGSG